MNKYWLWVGAGAVILLGILGWLILPRWVFAPTASDVPNGFSGAESENEEGVQGITVIAENLEIPWAIDFLPNRAMLVSERPGRIQYFLGEERRAIEVPGGVHHAGEGGLLGLAVHPDFTAKPWVYIYRTTEGASGIENTVERYRLTEDLRLVEQEILLAGIPGSPFHDGGMLKFGPDGFLYVTTGDAGQENLAQDPESLAGKILRITEDGEIPPDNPFGSPVWSLGHRNPQGITWNAAEELWATEHGRSGLQSGLDELNRIEPGKNYGWPLIEGDEQQSELVSPQLHSGADDTWAPAGASFWQGKLFFAGLRGQSLYEADVAMQPIELTAHLRGRFGRLRAVTVGPDGALYVSTSNRDGRGSVENGDDKILRIDAGVL